MGKLDPTGNPLVTLTSSGRDESTDLVVNASVTASVFGLTFTGATESAIINRSSLTLRRVAVTGNQATAWAGRSFSAGIGGDKENYFGQTWRVW